MISIATGTVIPINGSDRFRIDKVLGSGAMGAVFQAYDLHDNLDVALKTLGGKSDDLSGDTLSRLKIEFGSMAGVPHPNIVHLKNYFEFDGMYFYTMELLHGEDIVTHLRRGLHEGQILSDLVNLRSALRQLSSAISHLHKLRKAHRDIKPENVMFCEDGRVVLFDFGLLTGLSDHDVKTNDLVGTLGYMAPELFRGEAVTTAADWYSLGCVIYKCFTGKNVPRDYWSEKNLSTEFLKPLPSPYRKLVEGLLDPVAESRLNGLDIFDLESDADEAIFISTDQDNHIPELHSVAYQKLEQHWENWDRASPRVISIAGNSGIGKTVLMERFIREHHEQKKTLSLRGRCHPRESVAFPGIDTIINQISLNPDSPAPSISQVHASAAVRLFPVLARVLAAMPNDAMDTREVQRMGIAALRIMFEQLAGHRKLLVWIDDVQWFNAGSISLLNEIIRDPYAPAIFFVLTHRPNTAPSENWLEQLPVSHTRFYLQPVGESEAEKLIDSVLRKPLGLQEKKEIIEKAEGSPFNIVRLLGDRNKVQSLSRQQQQIFHVSCLLGRPIAMKTLTNLAGAVVGGLDDILLLCESKLLGIADIASQVKPYHDQLREEYIASLSEEELTVAHANIASSLLAQPDSDVYEIVLHLVDADDHVQIEKLAPLGAGEKYLNLAFDQAAELYGLAFEHSNKGQQSWVLLERQAVALAAAGRCLDAADVYESLARQAGGFEIGAAKVTEFNARCIAQRLHGGDLTNARKMLDSSLREQGLVVGKSALKLGVLSIFFRQRFRWSWSYFGKRYLRETTFAKSVARDSMGELSVGASMVDHLLFDVVSQQWLWKNLRQLDSHNGLTPLALEAARQSTVGGPKNQRRARKLLASIKAKAVSPMDHAIVANVEGLICYNLGLWDYAEVNLIQARTLLVQGCSDAEQELNIVRVYLFGTWANQGNINKLRAEIPPLLRDSRRRNNVLLENIFCSNDMVLLPLADDRPEDAISQMRRLMVNFPGSPYYSSQHYHHSIGMAKALLYAGRADEAWVEISGHWTSLEKAFFLATGSIGIYLCYVKALAASRYLCERPKDRLLRTTLRKLAKTIRNNTDAAFSEPMALAIDASLASFQGDEESAIQKLNGALQGFRALGMNLYVAACQVRLAELVDEVQAPELIARAKLYADSQGIVNIGRLSHAVIPGLHLT